MSETAIRVENLSKLYRIGKRSERPANFRESLKHVLLSPFDYLRATFSSPTEAELVWALKDVSLEVKYGEVVGIIGPNGAGKSTLLKVLSRITEPTSGRAYISGRIASLLEVGTGFHPELTGRENIYMNGAILGMSKKEIDVKFDEIVAFSEIEKFIDTPVKRYSSGMAVRLAFSVAAHLEPEILLIDEVLAVGDDSFQKKCLNKMDDVTNEGRTILFVSHNMGAITSLCERTLCLDKGRIASDGLSNEVVKWYLSKHVKACAEWVRSNLDNADSAVAFLKVAVRDREGQSTNSFDGDAPISFEMCYRVRCPLSCCQIGTVIYNSNGLAIFTTTDGDNDGVSALPKQQGVYHAQFTIPGSLLAPGTYYVLVAAHFPKRSVYEVIENAVTFEISHSGSLASRDGRLGAIMPLLPWKTIKEISQ